jgi:hypothetical protein
MSAREFHEWMIRYRQEPFDSDYKAAAKVSALIAEINRDRKKRRKPFTPQDFMPVQPKPKTSVVETIRLWHDMIEGKDNG